MLSNLAAFIQSHTPYFTVNRTDASITIRVPFTRDTAAGREYGFDAITVRTLAEAKRALGY